MWKNWRTVTWSSKRQSDQKFKIKHWYFCSKQAHAPLPAIRVHLERPEAPRRMPNIWKFRRVFITLYDPTVLPKHAEALVPGPHYKSYTILHPMSKTSETADIMTDLGFFFRCSPGSSFSQRTKHASGFTRSGTSRIFRLSSLPVVLFSDPLISPDFSFTSVPSGQNKQTRRTRLGGCPGTTTALQEVEKGSREAEFPLAWPRISHEYHDKW